MQQMGLYQIAVNTASLANGATIGSYLVDAAGNLLTSSSIGGKQRLDTNNPSEHLQGSAYAAGVDYLSSMGVVDSSGNWVPFTLNASGELPVAATVNFAGDYPEDSPHASGDVGLFSLAVRRDARTSGTSTDGDYGSFNVNASGELWVKDADSLAELVLIKGDTAAIAASVSSIDSKSTTIATNTGNTATSTASIDSTLSALSKAEDAAAASGDRGIQSLLVRQDTLASSTSTDGDYGSFKSNAAGELYTVDAGTRAAIVALSKAEDAVHSSGDQGIQALAVRKDAQGSNVSADGDYASFQQWSEGSLKVVDVANGAILQQQVAVSTTAAQVPAANLANRKTLMLQNTGSSKCWIGSATLTSTGAASGIELPANSFMELECGPAVAVFAKTNAGSGQLNVLEMA